MGDGALAEIYASQIQAIKSLSIFLTTSFARDGYSDRTETLEWYPRLSWEFVSRDEIRALRKESRGKSQERVALIFERRIVQRRIAPTSFQLRGPLDDRSLFYLLFTYDLLVIRTRQSDDCALAFPATCRVSQQVETRGWVFKFCMARPSIRVLRSFRISFSLSFSLVQACLHLILCLLLGSQFLFQDRLKMLIRFCDWLMTS